MRAANIAIWTAGLALVNVIVSFAFFGDPDWPKIMSLMLVLGAIEGIVIGAII